MLRQRGKADELLPETLKLPDVGETFGIAHMTPKTRALFERVSAIWDVPLDELAPTRGPKETGFLRSGSSGIGLDMVRLRVDDMSRTTSQEGMVKTEHELAHSLHYLLHPGLSFQPDERSKALSSKLISSEPLADAGMSRRRIATMGDSSVFLSYSSAVLAGAGASLAAAGVESWLTIVPAGVSVLTGCLSFAGDIVRGAGARRFTDKYGPDGWILLAVDGPYRPRKFRIIGDERRYLREGLLYPPDDAEHKGLTPKGLEYVRSRMPREKLLEKLRWRDWYWEQAERKQE